MHSLQNNIAVSNDLITFSWSKEKVQETAAALLGRDLTSEELDHLSERLTAGVDSSLDLLCRVVILEELQSGDFSG